MVRGENTAISVSHHTAPVNTVMELKLCTMASDQRWFTSQEHVWSENGGLNTQQGSSSSLPAARLTSRSRKSETRSDATLVARQQRDR